MLWFRFFTEQGVILNKGEDLFFKLKDCNLDGDFI